MSSSIIPPNRAKQLLREGRTIIGTFVIEFRQPAVMQFLSNAGFDFVLIDNEHGAFTNETIADLSRAAVQLGLTPIVRIPDISYPHLAQTLDIGAQGVMVPRVYSVEQVRQVIQMVRYPPLGKRGSAQHRGLTRFKEGPVLEVLEDIQRETMVVIQIETRQALEAIDDIVAVPGVDAILVGPNDLSIALGVPGQADHPLMKNAIQKVIDASSAHGITSAIHISNMELASYWIGQGMRMISTGSEGAFIIKAGRESIAALRKAEQKFTLSPG